MRVNNIVFVPFLTPFAVYIFGGVFGAIAGQQWFGDSEFAAVCYILGILIGTFLAAVCWIEGADLGGFTIGKSGGDQ